MKPYDVEACKILRRTVLGADCFDVTVLAPKLAPLARPGQFANILPRGKTLRRPISICGIGKDTLRFVFQVRGEGTKELAALSVGDTMDVFGPLGNGFPLDFPNLKIRRAAFVGGGIGTPPMLAAAAAFPGEKLAVLGFRTKAAVLLEEDFQKLGCKVAVTTDNGSYGVHGLVTVPLSEESFDVCYACGPAPMLKAVAALCAQRKIPCYVSLEQRMACGVGACLGCATPLRRPDGTVHYGHVCKDGPVFSAADVVFS